MSYEFAGRRFLGFGAALAGAGLLAACGGPAATEAARVGSAARSTVPRPGGAITYLDEKLIDGYQQQSTGSWHVAQVWNQLVERLFYVPASRASSRSAARVPMASISTLTVVRAGTAEAAAASAGLDDLARTRRTRPTDLVER
ncbi:hypothetical protein NLM24_29840 [Nocardia zapadnayensis]|nr:hypothetical protein [Nocardia zapadnayensis]MCX0274825.1 hypothetical protein [Nocardia zapadnayensis]